MPYMSLSHFERLPPDLMGNVLRHLFKDTPYRFEMDITSLMVTNKKIYALVNNERTINSFWLEMQKSKDGEELAFSTNTESSRRWLLKQAQNNGDYAAYLEVYRIFDRVNALIAQLGLFDPTYEAGFPTLTPLFRCRIFHRTLPINPFYCTEKTFNFINSDGNYYLVTPIGVFFLFDNDHLFSQKKTLWDAIESAFKDGHDYRVYFPSPGLYLRKWNLFESLRLGINPYSATHKFQNATEIMNGVIELLTILENESCKREKTEFGERDVKELYLEVSKDLQFSRFPLSNVLWELGNAFPDEKNFLKMEFCRNIPKPWLHRIYLISESHTKTRPFFPFDNLKKLYLAVFEKLRKNWVEASKKEIEEIDNKHKKEFYFYKKRSKFFTRNTQNLILSFAKALKIRSSIYLKETYINREYVIVLGIKKTDFNLVAEKLNFRLRQKTKGMQLPEFDNEKELSPATGSLRRPWRKCSIM